MLRNILQVIICLGFFYGDEALLCKKNLCYTQKSLSNIFINNVSWLQSVSGEIPIVVTLWLTKLQGMNCCQFASVLSTYNNSTVI